MGLGDRFKLAANAFVNGDTYKNKFDEAFLHLVGSTGSSYDPKGKTYIQQGFNINPIVYSVINQMATKTSSVPRGIKKIEDEKAHKQLNNLLSATKHNPTPQQEVKRILLESKAYKENEDMPLPLDRPNPMQTWNEFFELYKVFLRLNGNVYIYMTSPENGANAGTPNALYILPSHLVEIVVKDKVDYLSTESPVKGYILIEGNQYVEFTNNEVVHIKYANPNFDMNGSHLYGFAPSRALLKNIESSSLALDLNIKTMKNGGAFGLIHSKGSTPLTKEQAESLKDRLKEMDQDPDKLAKIAGVSAEIGFTRLSMTTEELKLFDYLNFDQKQICNVFGWSDKLLNNDASSQYGGTIEEYRKQVVVDNIIPDLQLFTSAFNIEILPKFKNYKGTELCFDYSELPEMQKDVKTMSDWVIPLRNNAMITGNQGLSFLGMPKSDNPLMDELITNTDYLTLEQSLDDLPTITND